MQNYSLDTPITNGSRFKLEYKIKSKLPADAKTVWKKITTIEEVLRWDSHLMEMQGNIGPGGKITLRSKLSPERSFSLKVSDYDEGRFMEWTSGMLPFFKGQRSYTLVADRDQTIFEVREVFQGIMLPLIKSSLPDCETMFGTYIRDLKNELQSSM